MSEQSTTLSPNNEAWLANPDVDITRAAQLESHLADRVGVYDLQMDSSKTPSPDLLTVGRPGYDGYGRQVDTTDPTVEAMVGAGFLQPSSMRPGALNITSAWMNERYPVVKAVQAAANRQKAADLVGRTIATVSRRLEDELPPAEIPRVTVESLQAERAARQRKLDVQLAELRRQRESGEL